MPIKMTPVDQHTCQTRISGFVPARVIDVHTHIWQRGFCAPQPGAPAAWADRVADHNTLSELPAAYRQLLPGAQVTPVLFGYPARAMDVGLNNAWVAQAAAESGCPALYLSTPDMPPAQLEDAVTRGGFRGLKPYPDFAPPALPPGEVTILDFLPRAHLEVAHAHGWVIVLHIPRAGRLGDPLNLAQLLEIEKNYPNLRLVVAHLGRAYCPEDLGGALDVIRRTERLAFDCSANTCAAVMEQILLAVGSRRVLFGSDMPITQMRMRRVCEAGRYVNLVPRGLYGDARGDPHMREVEADEAARLTFFLYEEIAALRAAAEAARLDAADIENIFFNNAARLFFAQS